MSAAVKALLERGVVIPAPEAVEVGEEVKADRIAPGVVIHAGCKVFGAETSMGPGCVLGEETPTASPISSPEKGRVSSGTE